ncbi:MAG: GTP cyclohydrolase I FolE [Lachnospiraceae bacterium]|nr:GTP cyclohydrolase I FolE [Lachnospiraceae bacterium]
MIDKPKIEQAVRMLLEGIGENPDREGLVGTPDRIARMCEELFSGTDEAAEKALSVTFNCTNDDLVLEKDIQFYSLCEHHLLPFYGKAHIAYLPNGKVAGLSKLARTVEAYARRAQIQEQLTEQIANAMMKYLEPRGVMIVIEAEHMCMTMRGVKKPGAKTMTYVCRGEFQNNPALCDRVLRMVGM